MRVSSLLYVLLFLLLYSITIVQSIALFSKKEIEKQVLYKQRAPSSGSSSYTHCGRTPLGIARRAPWPLPLPLL